MLNLDIDGMELQLKINRFRKDLSGESEYDNCCFMDFAVKRNGVNIYHSYKNMPWLTCDEVEEIRDTIAGIVNGSITQDKQLSFIELDIKFEFVFNDNKFSYADIYLNYWETEKRSTLTGNQIILCLDMYHLERILCYLQLKTFAKYDKNLLEKYCLEGVIKVAQDKMSFKIIDGEIAPGETPDYLGVVGIFINEREILDIVSDLENEKFEDGEMEYIHQTAYQLYNNLGADNITDWQKKYGIEILSCTCGYIEDGSPTVFIEKDEKYVYWRALGHNQLNKEHYYFPLNYVFDRKQYEQALEELKKFSEDKNIY